MQVKESMNYSEFKDITGNRNINPLHLSRLIDSMKEEHLISPIIVNQDYQVIDGQHRLRACKELNLPVHYIVQNGYNLTHIQRYNQNSKDWKMIDFISGYAELGNKDYQYLINFYEETDLTISSCVTLLSNSGSATNDIRSGAWKAKHKERAKEIYQWLSLISRYYKNVNRKTFVSALIRMYNNEHFNFAHFISKLQIQPTALLDCAKTDDYIMLIESIYNYKSRNKVNLRF